MKQYEKVPVPLIFNWKRMKGTRHDDTPIQVFLQITNNLPWKKLQIRLNQPSLLQKFRIKLNSITPLRIWGHTPSVLRTRRRSRIRIGRKDPNGVGSEQPYIPVGGWGTEEEDDPEGPFEIAWVVGDVGAPLEFSRVHYEFLLLA